jgi:hypothetical protein
MQSQDGFSKPGWSKHRQRRTAWLAFVLASASVTGVGAGEQRLEPCETVGRGYFRLPGSSTCIAMTADAKNEHRRRSSRKEIILEPFRDERGPQVAYRLGRLPDSFPLERYRSEVKLFVNAATMTEYGLLTTSVGLKPQFDSPPRRPNDPNDEFNQTGRRTLLERASIKLGSLSAGYMPSFFDFTPSLSFTTAFASEQNTTLIAFTHKVAGAVDLTLSLEDGTPRRITDPAWGEYRGQQSPDVVASARRNFDWGNLHAAVAAHPVRAVALADCCAPVFGNELGWAAMAGAEGWFDLGDMSGEFLFNVAASKGALDYLNVTNYPADFALAADGRVFLTESQALVASYAHYWTRQVRTVVTASGFRTRLETNTFTLKTEGLLLQGALEFIPRRGFVVGVEVNYHDDGVRGGDRDRMIPAAGNQYVSGVLFVRHRY